jgi:hypothetical protein
MVVDSSSPLRNQNSDSRKLKQFSLPSRNPHQGSIILSVLLVLNQTKVCFSNATAERARDKSTWWTSGGRSIRLTFSRAFVTFRIHALMRIQKSKWINAIRRDKLRWSRILSLILRTQLSMPTCFEFWTVRIFFGREGCGSGYLFNTRSEASKLVIRLIGQMRGRLSSSKTWSSFDEIDVLSFLDLHDKCNYRSWTGVSSGLTVWQDVPVRKSIRKFEFLCTIREKCLNSTRVG